jgi:hypothetical protein
MISSVTTRPTTQMYLKSFITTPVALIEMRCSYARFEDDSTKLQADWFFAS